MWATAALVSLVAARSEILSAAGFGLVAFGVGLIYIPAGVITGGLALLVVAKAVEGGE